jgi:hypothetical protein
MKAMQDHSISVPERSAKAQRGQQDWLSKRQGCCLMRIEDAVRWLLVLAQEQPVYDQMRTTSLPIKNSPPRALTFLIPSATKATSTSLLQRANRYRSTRIASNAFFRRGAKKSLRPEKCASGAKS